MAQLNWFVFLIFICQQTNTKDIAGQSASKTFHIYNNPSHPQDAESAQICVCQCIFEPFRCIHRLGHLLHLGGRPSTVGGTDHDVDVHPLLHACPGLPLQVGSFGLKGGYGKKIILSLVPLGIIYDGKIVETAHSDLKMAQNSQIY